MVTLPSYGLVLETLQIRLSKAPFAVTSLGTGEFMDPPLESNLMGAILLGL